MVEELGLLQLTGAVPSLNSKISTTVAGSAYEHVDCDTSCYRVENYLLGPRATLVEN
jgi:hypothetical protein